MLEASCSSLLSPSFDVPVDSRRIVVFVHQATRARSVRRGRFAACCWRPHATGAPHADPPRTRTKHRPTPRRGGGARTRDPCRQRRCRPGGARGISPLWTFICCSCFVGDVSRRSGGWLPGKCHADGCPSHLPREKGELVLQIR